MLTHHLKPSSALVRARRERWFRQQALFRVRFREELQLLIEIERDQQLDVARPPELLVVNLY